MARNERERTPDRTEEPNVQDRDDAVAPARGASNAGVAARAARVRQARAARAAALPDLDARAGGSGAPLPERTRERMERAFGTDFSDVRVHEGQHVDDAGATAYAAGSDIHLAPGRPQPGTESGDRILAHELAHVAQQRQGRVAATESHFGLPLNADPGLEAEADASAEQALAGAVTNQTFGSEPGLGSAGGLAVQGLQAIVQSTKKKISVRFVERNERGERIYADTDSNEYVEVGRDNTGNLFVDPYHRPMELDDELPTKEGKQEKTDWDDEEMQESSYEKQGGLERMPSPFISLSSPEHRMFSSSEEEDEENDREEQLERFKTLFLQRVKDRMVGGRKRQKEEGLKNTSRDERSLSRIAWVLEKLNQARTCVAVILSDHHIHAFANHHDQRLGQHLGLMLTAARELEAAKEAFKDLQTILHKSVVKSRGFPVSNPEKEKEKATRRLEKAINLLKSFLEAESGFGYQVHEVDKGHRGEKKHAELRAGDAVVKSLPEGETPKAAIGISKLCCGKCALALEALEEVHGVELVPLGDHLTVYYTVQGWPIPEFLKSPEAMQAFLGPEAFAIYQKYPRDCRKIIEGKKVEGGDSLHEMSARSGLQTDIYSSEEENEDVEMLDPPSTGSSEQPPLKKNKFEGDPE